MIALVSIERVLRNTRRAEQQSYRSDSTDVPVLLLSRSMISGGIETVIHDEQGVLRAQH